MQFEVEWHAVPSGLLCCLAGIYSSKFPIIEKIYNILDGVIQVNILWNKSPENGMDDAINIPKENQYIAKNVNILEV